MVTTAKKRGTTTKYSKSKKREKTTKYSTRNKRETTTKYSTARREKQQQNMARVGEKNNNKIWQE
jgi:hypothetical protein